MNNTLEESISNMIRYYREALPIFEEMVSSCNNDCQFSQMRDVTKNRHMVYMSSKGVNQNIINKIGAVLFGENNTHKKRQNRHKVMHETI